MAKVTNPLHSLSASGSVGRAVTFRATNGGSVCTRRPKSYEQKTAAQIANQQRMLDARESFRGLSAADLAEWHAVGVARRVSAWAAFFAEYQFQYVQHPAAPLIPEATL